ncbi:MAG: acyltransferase [Burkholderiaceae bacterium]
MAAPPSDAPRRAGHDLNNNNKDNSMPPPPNIAAAAPPGPIGRQAASGATAPTTATPGPGQRLESIQVLRGIAALLVVLHHVSLIPHEIDLTSDFQRWFYEAGPKLGSFGVDLFFAISGFVMLFSIQNRFGRGVAQEFIANRALRILPIYYLISGYVLFQIIQNGDPLNIGRVINTATLLPIVDTGPYENSLLSVSWTLVFEFLFYFVVASVIAMGARNRVAWIIGITIALPTIGRLLEFDRSHLTVVRFAMSPMMYEFSFGILAYVAWRSGWIERNHRLIRTLALLSIPVVVWIAGFDPVNADNAEYDGTRVGAWLRAFGWGIPAALMFAAALSFRVTDRQLIARPLLALGDASYTLYLFHLPVMSAVLRRMGDSPMWLKGIAAVVSSVIAAQIVYRLVDYPMTRISKRLLARLRARYADPAAPARTKA